MRRCRRAGARHQENLGISRKQRHTSRNVLFIAYYFPPIGGGGVQRSVKFVRYLPQYGFRPIVATGPGVSEDRWAPIDKGLSKQILERISIYRISVEEPGPVARWKGRAYNLLGMPGAFASWWVSSIQEVCEKAIREEKPDIIFATMSPFDSAIAADAISRRHSIPWVADLRDPWALDEMRIYSSSIHRRLEEKRMYSALSGAAAIIMNTPEATSALLRRFPELGRKVVSTITNGYDEDDFLHAPPSRNDGKFRIVHSGNLHTDLGMELRQRQGIRRLLGGSIDGADILTRSHVFLLKAIEEWIAEAPSVVGEIELVFVGTTTKGDELIARNGKMQEIVRFTGFLPHGTNLAIVRTADLLFLPMHNLPPGRRATIVPGKTYEYMATGKPILAAVPDGDARDFLEEAGTSYLCGPDDVDAMREILKRAYRVHKEGKLEKTPNREFISQFERRLLTQKLAGVFNRVLGK